MSHEMNGSDARHIWTLTKGPLTAACQLRPRPHGEEVIVTMGGVQLYVRAHADARQALIDAVTMRERMAARGWLDGAGRGSEAPSH